MGRKIHLSQSDVTQRISALEEELKKQSTKINKTKRKRLYSQLAQLRKAVQDPENFLVDPEEEAEKIRVDKEKRVQKKIEKKRKQILERKKQKRYQKRCLKCGSREHLLDDCTNIAVAAEKQTQKKPKQKKSVQPASVPSFSNNLTPRTSGFCYKCGSTEHSHKVCSHTQYALALCFYCGLKGHIARECPKNQKGLYRKGGSCFGCGSVRHTLKDCPVRHGDGKGKGRYGNKDQF